jgi:hypothetical protein
VKSKGLSGFNEVQKSQVPILWNCGEGQSRVGVTVTPHRSRQQGRSVDRLSVMSVTTSVPRARDEENRFPAR